MRKNLSLSVLILVLATVVLFAAPPADYTPDSEEILNLDWETFFDANDILMFVSNVGSFAYDNDGLVHGTAGLYYPFSGDTATTPDLPVVYAAGLWMGGTVGYNDTRIAVAKYDWEYVPGPMENGTYLPDDPSFKVYKIDKSSGPGDSDWDNWPVDQGAPLDGDDNPLLLGDQTLWTVFNDADPNQHTEYATDPLGIEVQQTVWGSNHPLESNLLYMKYKLFNEGGNTINDFYFAIWFDSDLGNAGDDLIGCDTLDNYFYTYNDGEDGTFGTNPPVLGGIVVSGPVEPAPGETADFDGNPLPDYRNVGMTGFNGYINGTDPYTETQAYNYLKSLQIDGDPLIDPATSKVIKYLYPGDPLTATGWIDEDPTDKRMMCIFGPFTFEPGDSQQVVIKLGALLRDDAESYHAEIGRLRDILMAEYSNAYIDPNTMHRNWAWAFDPISASVLLPEDDDIVVDDIDQNTVVINDTIVPFNTEILTSHPDFDGQVLKADFRVKGFINAYAADEGPLYDTTTHLFTISGETQASEPFVAYGDVDIVGRYSGDANNDGTVDIDDIVFMIEYIFNGGTSPRPLQTADCDCNEIVDIDDITYLIEYIFSNGPKPRAGC